jgi:hypothetical protein
MLRPDERPFRAVVIASRVVGEEGHVRGLSVECDVILVRTQIAIQNVPVLQRQHGVNNVHDLWVPRPPTRNMVDSALPLNLSRTHSRRGTPIGPPTPLGDLDGDMVLVDFVEGNQDYPIIIGALTHERTNRVLRTGVGWREGSATDTRGHPRRDEFYVHHMGCELRINDRGELLIDTVGAYEDASTEDASDDAYGQVRIRVKNGQRFTVAIGDDEDVLEVWKDGGQLRVDLGAGADQRIPLGDDLVAAIKDAIDAIDTFASDLATATPAPPNSALTVADVLAAYATPITGLAGKLVQAKNDLDAALSDLAKVKKT